MGYNSQHGGGKMFRYVHTNIIAKDSAKLIDFYKSVFRCKSIGETRDLSGDWLDRLTGLPNAHIVGEHLLLPGYGAAHPTLEIFSYDKMRTDNRFQVNQCGVAHLAFEVDDVEETLAMILAAGGGQIGEIVNAEYEDGRKAVFVYATDIEGNILELQSWSKK
jgi:predicted enzyme related to lactoylglutathione lyase